MCLYSIMSTIPKPSAEIVNAFKTVLPRDNGAWGSYIYSVEGINQTGANIPTDKWLTASDGILLTMAHQPPYVGKHYKSGFHVLTSDQNLNNLFYFGDGLIVIPVFVRYVHTIGTEGKDYKHIVLVAKEIYYPKKTQLPPELREEYNLNDHTT